MHHVIAPSQSIVYPPETFRGQWPPLQEHSNKTAALNTPFRLLLSFSYKEWIQLIIISSNFRYIFNQPNNLSTDYRHPSVHNIHCIATHTIIGIPLTFLLTNETVQCSWRSDCISACRHRDGALLWRHVNTMFPVEYVPGYNFLLASVSYTLNLDVKSI